MHANRGDWFRHALTAVSGSVALFASGAPSADCSAAEAVRPAEWRSEDYRAAAQVPQVGRFVVAPAPAPNHGFGVVLRHGQRVDLFWAYPLDADDLAGAVRSELKIVWPGCRIVRRKVGRLGGLPAQDISMRCPKSGKAVRTLLAVGRLHDTGTIEYSVTMSYFPRREGLEDAERAFDQIRTSFHIIRD
jgi:hypothetical protein